MSATNCSLFYWSDWLSDSGLRRSSFSARGLWMDLLCIAAQASPIGYLAVNKEKLSVSDIARMVGGSEPEVSTLIDELERNGVLSRDRSGTIYSRRLVRDFKRREEAKKNGKKGGNPSLSNQREKSQWVKGMDNGGLKLLIPEPVPLSEERKDAAVPAHSEELDFFRRGKELCGANSGGLLKRLLTAKSNNIALARSAVEIAATKQDPREYIGAIIRGREGVSFEEKRARGEAW